MEEGRSLWRRKTDRERGEGKEGERWLRRGKERTVKSSL